MQLSAILHTPLSSDAYMVDENTLTIRIRVAKNDVGQVFLYYGDRVCMQEKVETIQLEMEKIATDDLFDYYEVTFCSSFTRICYYFFLKGMDETARFYSEDGFTNQMNLHRTRYFQFPYLHRADIIKPPTWAKDMVMYHIFPDSFASAKRYLEGKEKQSSCENGFFCESKLGGNLFGIVQNLDYISSLGINCLYLNPIFKAASYHKYDTIDYFEIDPCFGTKNDLKYLVKECHVRGIKVILDGVFNHCGSGFFAFDDVRKKGEKSKYKDWFYKLQFPIAYETPPNYEAFAYVKEMPKLNTANQEVQTYFCEVGTYWIREVDIDGWRLDVANEINHDFWRAFQRAVKMAKPDAFLIGEIWEDSKVWLLGDQFDSTMNYTFTEICRDFFAKKVIGLKAFDEKINHMLLRYPKQVSEVQMNFLDTHDIARFLTYCNGNVDKVKFAIIFMMTCVGIPSIFYGDELLIEGETEENYRKAMPWKLIEEEKIQNKTKGSRNLSVLSGTFESEYDKELILFFQQWIQIRKENPLLRDGSYQTVFVDEATQIYSFKRYIRHVRTPEKGIEKKNQTGKFETMQVIFNFSKEEKEVRLDKEKESIWVDILTKKTGRETNVICPGMGVFLYKF